MYLRKWFYIKILQLNNNEFQKMKFQKAVTAQKKTHKKSYAQLPIHYCNGTGRHGGNL